MPAPLVGHVCVQGDVMHMPEEDTTVAAKSVKAKPKKAKAIRAVRGVSITTPDGEVRFEPGDTIDVDLRDTTRRHWLARGVIEEFG